MSREMKDSGVEWIGEIPEDWKVTKYKNFTENRMGETILASDTIEEGIPIYSATQEDKVFGYVKQSNLILHKGDFVIPARGNSIGCVTIVKDRIATCTQTTICSRNIHGINRKFLFYCCYGLKKEWFKYEGSAIPQITVEQVKNNILSLPSKDEQQKIANFLDKKVGEIDRLIDNAKRSIEEYKKYKQSVITEAVTKGLDNNVEMKDSGIEWIGNIPKDWKIIKMNRLIVSTQNGLSRRNLNNSIGKIVLKLSNMTIKGTIDYSCVNRIDLSDKEIESYGLQEGDFLFVRVNGSKSLVGKCAIYRDIGEPVAFNDHIIRVKINRFCNKKYFLWYLLSNSGKKEIDTHITTAAGQFTINGNSLRDLNISLPPIKEQEKIINYLDSKCIEIDNLISKKEKLILELESYKKSLIYEYVTGKKEVL